MLLSLLQFKIVTSQNFKKKLSKTKSRKLIFLLLYFQKQPFSLTFLFTDYGDMKRSKAENIQKLRTRFTNICSAKQCFWANELKKQVLQNIILETISLNS